jgi:hypothetical protein
VAKESYGVAEEGAARNKQQARHGQGKSQRGRGKSDDQQRRGRISLSHVEAVGRRRDD